MIEDRYMKHLLCKPARLEAGKDANVVKPGTQKKRKLNTPQEPYRVRLTGTFMALEPVILFDGPALPTGAEVVQDTITPGNPGIEGEVSTDSTHADSSDQDALCLPGLSFFAPPARKEMERINPTAEVILLDSTRDGIEQITEALKGRMDIGAIHLISHGNQAELQLGTGHLTFDLMRGEYVDELTIITDALADTGNILIYGCNFGEREAGRAVAWKFTQITDVDIAASTDLPGSANFGVKWDLELSMGFQNIINGAEPQECQGLLTETTYIASETVSSEMENQANEVHSTKPWGQIFSYDSLGSIYSVDRIGLVLSSTFPSGPL